MKMFLKLMLSTVMNLKSSIVYIFFILSIIYSYKSYAQESTAKISAKNAVYLEVGGTGLFYTVNYDRIFFQKGSFKAAGRVGFSLIPVSASQKIYIGGVLPIEVLGLIGNNRKNFEFGVGYTFQIYPKTYLDFITSEKIYQDSYYLRTYIPLRLGYRYQKPEGGLFFRIGYTPVFQYSSEDKRVFFSPLFGGLSIGKSF